MEKAEELLNKIDNDLKKVLSEKIKELETYERGDI